MIGRVLIGVGLFALGYVIGKGVGSSRAIVQARLDWDRDEDQRVPPMQVGPDAEFAEARPEAQTRREAGSGAA